EMVVRAIDDRHVHRRAAQHARRVQAGEPAAQDQDAGTTAGLCHRLIRLPTTTTATVPTTLYQRKATEGAQCDTANTALMPAMSPTKAPVARARGSMANTNTPRIEP